MELLKPLIQKGNGSKKGKPQSKTIKVIKENEH